MKKFVCLLSFLFLTGSLTSLRAQASKSQAPAGAKKDMKSVTPDEQAKKEATHAEKQLGLSADQKLKWQEAALTRIKANRPLREKMQGSTTPEERKKLHEVARSNRETFDASVAAILKPEQIEKYEEMKRNRQAKMQERRKERSAGAKPGTEQEPGEIEE